MVAQGVVDLPRFSGERLAHILVGALELRGALVPETLRLFDSGAVFLREDGANVIRKRDIPVEVEYDRFSLPD